MKSKTKVHFIEDTETSDWDGEEYVTALTCGISLERPYRVSCTYELAKVTCGNCLRIITTASANDEAENDYQQEHQA